MSSHTISVIIPTYNRAHTIGRAIYSVIAQHYAPLEIIVVDDESTDDTHSLITQQFPTVQYHKISHGGVSAARNAGIKIASGDWIALLDSDDEWLAPKLQHQVDMLIAEPDYKICHANEIWIRNGTRVNAMNKHQKQGGHIYRQCLPLCAMSPSSVLIHKKVIDDVGYFDESFPACEDYDMWLKICSRYPVLYSEKALIKKYGGHVDQLSRQHWGMDRFRIKALTNILKGKLLNHQQRIHTIEMLHKKCDIFITGAKKRNNIEAISHYESVKQQNQV